MKLLAASLLALGMLAQQSDTVRAAAPATFKVYGSGNNSCGTVVTDTDQAHRDIYILWVLGFVSGAGFQNDGRLLSNTDAPAITAWISLYCQDHPLENLARAAMELVSALKSRTAA